MKKYQKYKDSEVEWLGKIPEHWEIIRIKDIINKIGSGVTPKGGSSVYVDKGVIFLRSQNVYDDGLRIEDVSFISDETHDKMKNSQIKPYDILVNITGASIGRSCVVPTYIKEANINQHIIFLRFRKDRVPFLTNYIKSNIIKEYINLIQAGSSKEALNMGQTLVIPTILPPQSEQEAIANFLNTKTKTINQKITLLQQKVTYYKALRKSLINETVCRGLDKNVKLKDSGIEWIGKIPDHWEVMRIKEIFNISRGRVIAKTELNDERKFPVYSSQTKNNGVLGYINTYDFNTDLLTWTTDGVNAGTVFKRSGKFSCTNICGTLIPKYKKKISLEFFNYSVQESTKHNKRIDTNGAKIMSNEMGVIHIIHPPLEEQVEIANYLDGKNKLISSILSNCKNQIKLMKELRKTLINDVVTGKIKVSL